MFNKIILQGNLTRDVEVRYTQGGSAIGNTGIAINRKFKDATGQQKEEVMFVDLTFFGRTAEVANQYTHKGSNLLIEGRLKLEQWTAQDGTKRSKHVVIVETMQMLDSKGDTAQNAPAQPAPQAAPAQPVPQAAPAQPVPQAAPAQPIPQAAPAQPVPQAAPAQPAPQPAPAQPAPQPAPAQPAPQIDINEDEIPF